MNTTFKEKQKLSDWALGLVTLLLTPIGLLFIYGIYQQIFLGEVFGDKPVPDVVLVLLFLLIFGLLVFFWALNLQTKIDQTGIQLRFFLFIKKELKWSEIAAIEVVDYGFIGGWGIRFTQQYGTAYTTKGRIGIAIQLNSGKKLLLGTQKGAEVEAVLKKYLN